MRLKDMPEMGNVIVPKEVEEGIRDLAFRQLTSSATLIAGWYERACAEEKRRANPGNEPGGNLLPFRRPNDP